MRLVLPALVLAACTGAPPPEPAGPDPQASALAAQKLCYVFQHVGEKCRASQDLVEVGDTTHKVEATVNHKVDVAGTAARNVRFEVSLAGEPAAFGVDVLGKGTSPEDALDRAAQDWAALVGTALVDSVQDTGRSEAVHSTLVAARRASKAEAAPVAIPVSGFHAYPGLTDFRGAVEGGPVIDHAQLLESLSSRIMELDASTPHLVYVAVSHDRARLTCDRGQVDGQDVIEICRIAQAFGWPTPRSPYAARQAYVLVPGPAPVMAAPEPEAPGTPDTDAPGADQ